MESEEEQTREREEQSMEPREGQREVEERRQTEEVQVVRQEKGKRRMVAQADTTPSVQVSDRNVSLHPSLCLPTLCLLLPPFFARLI